MNSNALQSSLDLTSELSPLEATEAARSERARRSLRAYTEQAWHLLEPDTPFVPGYHSDAICDHLQAVSEGTIRDLLINCPPGHSKSTLASVMWPTWHWIDRAGYRFIYASHSGPLAVRDAVRSRDVLSSDWYRQRWGDRFTLTTDQNEKTRYVNDRTGYRLTTSVHAMSTGERAHAVVVDDPHDIMEAYKLQRREYVKTWYARVFSSRRNDLRTGPRVVIGQRIHADDLSAMLMGEGGWERLVLPMAYDPKKTVTVAATGWKDPRTKAKAPLWPARYGQLEIEREKKTLGSYAFSAQAQQDPAPDVGNMIQRDWWQFYERAPKLAELDRIILSWDMAFKGKATSDYVAGGVWGQHGSQIYLLDLERDRMDFPTTLKRFVAQCTKWPTANAKLVEDAANGPAVVATLKRSISGLILVPTGGGIEALTASVSPLIEAGDVWLPKYARWVHEFVDECARFPNGTYDDQVAQMAHALWYLTRPRRRRPQVRVAVAR